MSKFEGGMRCMLDNQLDSNTHLTHSDQTGIRHTYITHFGHNSINCSWK